jgi:S-(hydroxymethyl)glutathione dehydrogenase / alcohol dehydrogenase
LRAMVYRGPYKVRVEDKDVPPIEHPNDAIVRVKLAAICGSDLHLYHGMMPDTRVGMTFGHEFVGVIEQVGSTVRNVKVGDRVMVPFNIFCGTCWFCARGLYSNCHNVNPNATAVGGIYGYSHTCGGYDGGQSEFVRVPFADVGPSPVPALPDVLLAAPVLVLTVLTASFSLLCCRSSRRGGRSRSTRRSANRGDGGPGVALRHAGADHREGLESE